MMLEFLGEDAAAVRVRDALAGCDELAGTTSDLGDAIADRVQD